MLDADNPAQGVKLARRMTRLTGPCPTLVSGQREDEPLLHQNLIEVLSVIVLVPGDVQAYSFHEIVCKGLADVMVRANSFIQQDAFPNVLIMQGEACLSPHISQLRAVVRV